MIKYPHGTIWLTYVNGYLESYIQSSMDEIPVWIKSNDCAVNCVEKKDPEELLSNIKIASDLSELQQNEHEKKIKLINNILLSVHDLLNLAFTEAVMYPHKNKYHGKYISTVIQSEDCDDGYLFGQLTNLQPELRRIMEDHPTDEFVYKASEFLKSNNIRVIQNIRMNGFTDISVETKVEDTQNQYSYRYRLDTDYHENHSDKCSCDFNY